ncbi:MAG: RNA polymerase sigma factor [Oscillospiraceae bacterium]
MEEQDIVGLFWQRDEEAIAACRAQYGGYLTALAGRILQSPEDAEECVSDTYLKAWQHIPPERPVHLRAYLAKLCRFLAFGRLDWQNADKRKAELVELTEELAQCLPDKQAEQALESRELGRALDRFLRTLGDEPRRIFLRRYWFADSIVEIAARFGVGESKVKTSLFRTRQKLRTFLESEGYTV